MKRPDNLVALTNEDNHNCFGCSPANPYGLRMKFFSDGEALHSWLTVPDHLCGWDGLVHGGIVATILDEIMGRAAIYFLKTFALTSSITTEFLKPVRIGDEIRTEARVLDVRNKREAVVEGHIYKGEKTVCAKCVGTFRLFTAAAISKLGVMDEEMLEKYEFLIEP